MIYSLKSFYLSLNIFYDEFESRLLHNFSIDETLSNISIATNVKGNKNNRNNILVN